MEIFILLMCKKAEIERRNNKKNRKNFGKETTFREKME